MFTRVGISRIVSSVLFGSLLLAGSAAVQAATIQGTVKGPDGKPISGAEVRIEGMKSTQALKSVKTDQKGNYVFKDVAVGTYKLTTWVNKVPTQIGNVKARSEGVVRVDFDIKATAAKAGAKKTTHRVWVEGKTGSHIGGHWVELDENGNPPPGEPVENLNGKDAFRNVRDPYNPNPGQ